MCIYNYKYLHKTSKYIWINTWYTPWIDNVVTMGKKSNCTLTKKT